METQQTDQNLTELEKEDIYSKDLIMIKNNKIIVIL